MAWPNDVTFNINEVSTGVWHELKNELADLVTDGSDPILAVMGRRGAFEAFSGGAEWSSRVWITDGAVADIVFDPSAGNSTDTGLNTAGFVRDSFARYRYAARTRNVHHNQALPRMIRNPRAFVDRIKEDYREEFIAMLNGMVAGGNTTNGFWRTTAEGTTVTATFANAKALFADQTSDYADVDVSVYTKWKPWYFTLAVASSDGSSLIEADLQKAVNTSFYAGEGISTDFFTTQAAWEKVRANMISEGVLALGDINSDTGTLSLRFAGSEIHWSRRLSNDAGWNLDGSNTTTAETPFFGIDMGNFYMRYAPGMSGGVPTAWSPVGLIDLTVDQSTPVENRPMIFRRLEAIYQFGFRRSRRTSGFMEGLKV